MTTSTSSKLLIGAGLLGLLLRVLWLDSTSVQVDEAMSLLAAARWRSDPHFDVHPPFFLILLELWGRISLSEAWLRLLGVLASLASMALAAWQFPKLWGPAALLMWACSFADIQQAREIRHYPWLELWAVLHLSALHQKRPGWSAVTLLGACFTHLFGWFLLPMAFFWKSYKHIWVLPLWFLWAIPHYGAQADHPLGLRPVVQWSGFLEAPGRVVGGQVAAFGDGFSLALGFAALGALALRKWSAVTTPAWLYYWALGPWLSLSLLSALTPIQLFEFKYLYWTVPAWASLLSRWWPIWVSVNLWGLWPWLWQPQETSANWRAVAGMLKQYPGVRCVHPSMMTAPLLYYGVPDLLGVDVANQVPLRGPWVWVETPYHPYVSGLGLKRGFAQKFVQTHQVNFSSKVPSCEVQATFWEGPTASGGESTDSNSREVRASESHHRK